MKKYYKILGLIFAIVLSLVIFIFRDSFFKLQGYGLFGLFVLSIIGNATIIFPTPVVFTAFVAGAIFNPWLVALIVSFGATIGELTGYLAGYGAEDLVENDLKLKKAKSWLDKYGLWTLFVLAAVPNPFFDLAGIVAGAAEISVKKYFLVVWAGKLIKFGTIAILGSNSIGLIDKFI